MGDQPYVLAGYSSGGLLAHAAAGRLEASGAGPVGVVLLDTYPPGSSLPSALIAALGRGVVDGLAGMPWADEQLTAMVWYADLFRGWEPSPIAAPTLLVRPGTPAGTQDDVDPDDGDWRSGWRLAGDVLEVPGDHTTMLEAQAAATRQVVEAWLSGLRPEG